MHILFINHEYPPIGGGAASVSLHLAKEMSKQGHKITVVTSAFSPCPHRELSDGVNIIRIPAFRRCKDRSNPYEMLTFLFSSLWWMSLHGRSLRIDVCLAFFGIPGAPAAYLLKKIVKIPYVISLQGGDVPGFLPESLHFWHTLTGGIIRFLWKHSSSVVANSQGLTHLAQIASPQQKIYTIPNAVDSEEFYPIAEASSPCADTVSLIWTGRLNIQKNLGCLFEALARLQEHNWHLTMLGDGPERESLQKKIRELQLSERITMRNWVPRSELPDWLRQADIFVFPSIQEGMPIAVLEAMASGLPVVACQIEGCEEIILPGKTGLLVPPNNAKAFADALEILLINKELRLKMGCAAHELAYQKYSWVSSASEYLALCQKAIAANTTP